MINFYSIIIKIKMDNLNSTLDKININSNFNTSSSNPALFSYYIPIFIVITIIIILLFVFLYDNDMNIIEESFVSHSARFDKNLPQLKKKYLIPYLLARSSLFCRIPYYYYFYKNNLENFSNQKLIFLYSIDAISALIFGPMTGRLSDKYGRKKFCLFYNLSVIINIICRFSGNIFFSYISQIINGFGSGIICTIFEAWFVCHTNNELGSFEREKYIFLLTLFKDTNIFDGIVCIISTLISSLSFYYINNWSPFILSLILSLGSFGYIWKKWEENENDNYEVENDDVYTYGKVIKILTKKKILSIGIVDGIYQFIFFLYFFVVGRILKEVARGRNINNLYVFLCLCPCFIIGAKVYGPVAFSIDLNSQYYYFLLVGVIFIFQCFVMLLIFISGSFFMKLILFMFLSFLFGMFNPVDSIIKTKIIKDKYRAWIMNLFRVPLNILLIWTILGANFIGPSYLTLFASLLALVNSIIGFYLYFYYSERSKKK